MLVQAGTATIAIPLTTRRTSVSYSPAASCSRTVPAM
jgi:hypothetical protein